MSIRFKLLLSNIIMTVVPIFTAIILFIILIGVSFDKSGLASCKNGNSFDKVTEDTFKEFVGIINDALNNPDKLKDIEYLKRIDKKLETINSGVSFVIENKIYYISEKADKEKLEKLVQKNDINRSHEWNHESYEKNQYLNYDFKLTSGEKCTLYIFVDSSPIKKFFATLFSNFTKYFLLIILVANGILTIIVSQSIIKPLKKLKYGVEQIKDGNLSFEINEKTGDEVGDVCRAFEEMRKRLLGALEQQLKFEEERNEFIASISHDLKTPITSIKGHIEGIRDGVADTPQKSDKYMEIIYKKTIDMDRLINDLTFYSNQTLKKVPFNFSKVNLRIFIEDMIDEYQIELENLGIGIETVYDLDDNTVVKADVEKLKRVVTNIFENSIKHMDKQDGKIIIDVTDNKEKVLIGIHDNGEGIKEEYLSKIFTRFYRADVSRNTSKGGSGLGLAIAKQIIEEHGGSIWAQSEFGKGTAIYFELEKIGGLG